MVKYYSSINLTHLIVGFSIILMACFVASCQKPGVWNGKQAAVCLTYDDALESHLDSVIPLLEKYQFNATFYVPASFPGFENNKPRWAEAAKAGHELGNHSLFHPCNGQLPGREWVMPENDLSTYSVKRFMEELTAENLILSELDHLEQRTFAYTCGDMEAGGESFVEEIRKEFMGARGVEGKLESIEHIDLNNIGSFVIMDHSGPEMIKLVDGAIKENSLIVFLFHGVGGDHSINVDTEAHAQLIGYLDQHKEDIWVAPLREIVGFVSNNQPPGNK